MRILSDRALRSLDPAERTQFVRFLNEMSANLTDS
jgi:hypothetical protein